MSEVDPCNGSDSPAVPIVAALSGQPAESMKQFTRFVGLDVHKRTVMACVLDASGRKLHQEEFACRPEQLERFAAAWLGVPTRRRRWRRRATHGRFATCSCRAAAC